MDFNLGDITGLQVLQWINEQKMETPVIMMTAAGTEEVAVEAMKLGAYDYVRKEHLELNHFPILLHGVYERYLFRKDKQAREIEEREKEKMEAAVQMFQTTVRTIAHHINNALAIFKLQSSVCERNVQKMLDPALAKPLLKLVSDLRRQAKTVEINRPIACRHFRYCLYKVCRRSGHYRNQSTAGKESRNLKGTKTGDD